MSKFEQWGPCPFTVRTEGAEPIRIIVKGRDRWALEALMQAGPDGVTPITNPAPRWAAYVHNLRCAGVFIETVTEPHDGAFSGHHARYVLRATVKREGGVA